MRGVKSGIAASGGLAKDAADPHANQAGKDKRREQQSQWIDGPAVMMMQVVIWGMHGFGLVEGSEKMMEQRHGPSFVRGRARSRGDQHPAAKGKQFHATHSGFPLRNSVAGSSGYCRFEIHWDKKKKGIEAPPRLGRGLMLHLLLAVTYLQLRSDKSDRLVTHSAMLQLVLDLLV